MQGQSEKARNAVLIKINQELKEQNIPEDFKGAAGGGRGGTGQLLFGGNPIDIHDFDWDDEDDDDDDDDNDDD